MPAKTWPPPGFPLVQGCHALDDQWTIELPEPFARRVEEGSLVLWRPGLTLWITQLNNDPNLSQAYRLASIKEAASPERFAERETQAAGLTRLSYRLHEANDDGPVESVSGYVIADASHLQLSVYFDDPADEAEARQLVDSVAARRRA